MAILSRIKKMIAAFAPPAEADYMVETVAYRSQPDEREFRFSPTSVLRHHH